ncbi:MAG: FAD-dependent monooxygenase [Burkholderiaceae bacterium]
MPGAGSSGVGLPGETPLETPVLIVGAGPIGLGMALELAYRRNASIVVEQGAEPDGGVILAKATGLNERSLELLRRWGLSDAIARFDYPDDLPMTTFYCTALNGKLLGADPRPSIRDRPIPPFSPVKRRPCPQHLLDPLLTQAARRTGMTTIRFGSRLETLQQNEQGVTARIRDAASGGSYTIRARFAVACDGAGSTVRRLLGIPFPGRDLGDSISAIVRIPDFRRHAEVGRGARYMFIGANGTWSNLLAMNGSDVWRLVLMGPDAALEPNEAQMAAAIRRALGREDLPFEILRLGRWRRSQCLAERYRAGRVMLAGDAAHTMSPTGGHGLNTGFGDVFSLGWMLDAMLHGWGGEHLLDAYGAERRPIAFRNGEISSENFSRWLGATDFSRVFDESPGGDAERERIGRELSASLQQEWFSVGVAMGYRYEGSPIVVNDGTPAPPDEISSYTQTARPGHRAPHAWLTDGRSTIDLFGRGFVLLRFGGPADDVEPLIAAAHRHGVPVSVVDIDVPEIATLYERRLVLVRPDGHVAWRGDELPGDPLELIDVVRGAGGRSGSSNPNG